MSKETIVRQPREFAVPIELLKSFRNDVRVKPEIPHANGWIIFDHQMLVNILKEGDAKARAELAVQIEKMARAGGEMIIMQG